MLDSIYVGMSGLAGYSKGLRVIANNSANLNTPGFKGATLQFADQFYSHAGSAGEGSGANVSQIGHGLTTYSTQLNFRQGELRQTGNDLDLAVDGEGLFVVKSSDGQLRYSRAGQFEFNTDGMLVTRTDGSTVMASGPDGALVAIGLTGLRTNPASATKTVTLTGNLSSTEPDASIGGIKVIDGVGAEHSLTLKLTNDNATEAGRWKAELLDGTTSVGTATIVFVDGKPTAATAKLGLTYKPAGVPELPLTIDLSADVTSFASGTLSSLAASKQDGTAAGALTKVTFDNAGVLTLAYSNGQTVKNAKLALARFDSLEAVEASGNNAFIATDERAWTTGNAGDGGFGKVQSGSIEISNVDLSQEFSDLVIMQRGYQASSQIVSTANDMIQELFAMKSK